jgi:hypothetical protein
VSRDFAEHFKLAKKRNEGRDEIESLRHEENTELNIIDYEIETLTTSYYLNVARHKFLEIPSRDNNGYWVESSLDPSQKVLSNKAISELRGKIRKDRKEYLSIIAIIISAITGLTGAAIGLIAFVSGK